MDRRTQVIRNAGSVASLLALAVFLAVNISQKLTRQRFERAVRARLIVELDEYPGAHLAEMAVLSRSDKTVINAVVRTPNSLTPEQVGKLEDALPGTREGAMELHVRSVLVKEAVRGGYLHQLPDEAQGEFDLGLPVELKRKE